MNSRAEVNGKATPHQFAIGDDRVMSFDDWCELNGFSRSTGQRLIASGQGPVFVQLSDRRKGVTVGENRRWLKAREIETAA